MMTSSESGSELEEQICEECESKEAQLEVLAKRAAVYFKALKEISARVGRAEDESVMVLLEKIK